ncbi:tripartite tricarboxylate transporter substrate binding protein [Salinarimonas sp. NSM]|uniref:tripartite tricarboxylate transporter substrate binding protein n=1 Tax=Salinarimonas sp. NSM TaxID=3458003 RepID=UPI0040367158
MRHSIRTTAAAFGAAALALLAPAQASAQDAYPSRAIEVAAPYDAGGATDRMVRHLSGFLAEELGVPVNVVNRPGGATFNGTLWFYNQEPDGYTVLFLPPTPYMVNHIEVMGAPYTLDDFVFVNAQEVAQSLMVVPKDSTIQSLDDVIAAMREPGRLSAAVIGGSSEHISLLLMMEKLDIPASNIRLVTFDGGGPTRTAIMGGQVDLGMVPGQGSEVIFDSVRKIAVVAEEANPSWPDAVPINEALASYGVELPILDSSVRSMVVHAAFAEQHPDRYQAFVDAYQRVVESPEYQEAAAAGNYGRDWRGPEASTDIVRRNYQLLSEYSRLLE